MSTLLHPFQDTNINISIPLNLWRIWIEAYPHSPTEQALPQREHFPVTKVWTMFLISVIPRQFAGVCLRVLMALLNVSRTNMSRHVHSFLSAASFASLHGRCSFNLLEKIALCLYIVEIGLDYVVLHLQEKKTTAFYQLGEEGMWKRDVQPEQ